MQFRALAVASAASLIIALAARPAGATVVSIPPLEEMAPACDVIAEVVVGLSEVVKEGGRIVTYTTLEVRDGWKGAKAGDQLRVFQVGGTLDGRTAWIAGAHRYVAGERLVFFGMRHAAADRAAREAAGQSAGAIPAAGSHGFAEGVHAAVGGSSFGAAQAGVIGYGIGFGLFKVDEQLTGEKVVELVGDVVAYERPATAGAAPRTVTPRTRRFDTLPSFKAAVLRMLELQPLPALPSRSKHPGVRPPLRPLAPPAAPAAPAPSSPAQQGG